MYILILLLIVVVIFKFLFSNFGNLNERDISERDKILDQLSRMMNNGGQNEIIIKDVSVNDNVNDGREIDINNELINTAKKVIETVNLALSNNDEKVLSDLLSLKISKTTYLNVHYPQKYYLISQINFCKNNFFRYRHYKTLYI